MEYRFVDFSVRNLTYHISVKGLRLHLRLWQL